MIFGGGSASDVNGNPTGYAYSSGFRGLYFNSDTINAGGGAINVMGKSSKTTISAAFLNGTTMSTTAAAITLQGLSTGTAALP